jgi:lantibiotic modifying enzyme
MGHEEKITISGQEVKINQIRQSIARIIDDYEKTAKTLDAVTKQVDGLNATNHAKNVESLKKELLSDLNQNSIKPPWEREGYDTKKEWLQNK